MIMRLVWCVVAPAVLLGACAFGTSGDQNYPNGVPKEVAKDHLPQAQRERDWSSLGSTSIQCHGESLTFDESQERIFITDNCETITINESQIEVVANYVQTVVFGPGAGQSDLRAHTIANRVEVANSQNVVRWENGDPEVVDTGTQNTVAPYSR